MNDDSQTLILAIQKQSVPDLPPKVGVITAARDACIQIGKETSATCAQIITALERNGISALALPPIGPSQFHSATLRIHSEDLKAAIQVMEAEGFRPPCPITPARLTVIRRTQTALRFVSFDEVTTRISLVFADRPKSLLPKALRPQIQDIAEMDLPAPLYTGWRAARLVTSRITGRTALGENDFLGTPVSLVVPLMKAVGVTPEDTVLDLGCGDGRVLIEAVQALGCRGLGVELNPRYAQQACDRVGAAALKDRITIITGGIDAAPLANATVIFVFLPHSLTAKHMPDILAAQQPGTRVVIHEQTPLSNTLTPDRSIPLITENALTVAHIWDGA